MRLVRAIATGSLLAFFGFNAAGAGCNPQSAFRCATNEDCIAQGADGICEPNTYCSFPDPGCVGTMRRWHDRATASLAGMCVDPGGDTLATATDTDTDGSGTMGETEDPTNASMPTTDATTMPVDPVTSSSGNDPSGDPTGDPPDTTGGGMMTGTTAAAGACDAMYGAAEGYMFCTEMVDQCQFVATLNMAMGCEDVCVGQGGTCIGADLNDVDPCTSTAVSDCADATSNDAICTCSL